MTNELPSPICPTMRLRKGQQGQAGPRVELAQEAGELCRRAKGPRQVEELGLDKDLAAHVRQQGHQHRREQAAQRGPAHEGGAEDVAEPFTDVARERSPSGGLHCQLFGRWLFFEDAGHQPGKEGDDDHRAQPGDDGAAWRKVLEEGDGQAGKDDGDARRGRQEGDDAFGRAGVVKVIDIGPPVQVEGVAHDEREQVEEGVGDQGQRP